MKRLKSECNSEKTEIVNSEEIVAVEMSSTWMITRTVRSTLTFEDI